MTARLDEVDEGCEDRAAKAGRSDAEDTRIEDGFDSDVDGDFDDDLLGDDSFGGDAFEDDDFEDDPFDRSADASADPSDSGGGSEGIGWRGPLLLVALAAAVLVMCVVAAGIGAYGIPVGDVLDSVLNRCGLGGHRLDQTAEAVLWEVRFPRIVLTLLIGASLACAGALMQGVFGNPLAEPGVVGVSAGATVGAVLVIF
ncbi:iron chelate uptake ABC transporter family permease subunit, partial [Streptodolium elevatio]